MEELRANGREEVIAISDSSLETIKEETLQLKPLLEKELLKGNISLLTHVVNWIYRIKRCVDSSTIQKVKEGDTVAIEKALRSLLLSNCDGPIVRYLEIRK